MRICATAGRLLQQAAARARASPCCRRISRSWRSATRTAARSRRPTAPVPVQDFLARTAQRLRMWIVAGSVPLASGGGRAHCPGLPGLRRRRARAPRATTRSTCSMSSCPIAPRAIASPRTWRPADKVVTVDTPAGRLGLSVCYDLRFPELYRRLQAAGAQWFVVPAAFTAPTGAAHWEPLLRARAIENLCYVVASAQWGMHPNGRRTWGHSLIVDHWGRVLAQLPDGEGVIIAPIDLAAQAEARRKFPALSHRVRAERLGQSRRHDYRTNGNALTRGDAAGAAQPAGARRPRRQGRLGADPRPGPGRQGGRRRPVFPGCRRKSPGRWRTASSRKAAPASSRASACARMAGERTGFAYSDEIQPQALEEAARAARAIAGRGESGSMQAWHRVHGPQPLSAGRSAADAVGRAEGRLARARRSRDAQARSAHRARHGERARRARD